MIEDQSPGAQVEQNADGTANVPFQLYALALLATSRNDKGLAVIQEASWTYAPADKDAHADGLAQAEEKWPAKRDGLIRSQPAEFTLKSTSLSDPSDLALRSEVI